MITETIFVNFLKEFSQQNKDFINFLLKSLIKHGILAKFTFKKIIF
ncbi:hypothetical protein BGAPBR_Q0058 (plasmid) [Borreliella garinii PBr]|uniref:Uncharacterized protein n=1 Tax=Borreliella garinii PBr TaxID=498743 RepID=B8F1D5_BORGR|nr:hypothetical protein BGAPBR_Q0058 [Borreliella garinii PBr]